MPNTFIGGKDKASKVVSKVRMVSLVNAAFRPLYLPYTLQKLPNIGTCGAATPPLQGPLLHPLSPGWVAFILFTNPPGFVLAPQSDLIDPLRVHIGMPLDCQVRPS